MKTSKQCVRIFGNEDTTKKQKKNKFFVSSQWVILKKDNLLKHNFHVSTKCVLHHHDQKIERSFFGCIFARSIWSAIQKASNL
jgi:hypothetical protein